MKPTLAVLLLAPFALHAAEPITNSIGIKLMPIHPGTFTMGQDGPPLRDYLRQKQMARMHEEFERAEFDEKPAHKVTITQPFLMGVTEVTIGQYRQFDAVFAKNHKRPPADDEAVCGVTWEQAVAFCDWLSKKEGKPYRLPTEAEWEYACRAGTKSLFHTGDKLPDGHQNYFAESNFRGVYFPDPMPREYEWRKNGPVSLRVGQKTPNAWGLHDMHGNVAEWCLDWYGPYEAGDQVDPLGRVDGDCRVFRGGFHSTMIRFLRSANRGCWVQNSPSPNIGFRVVQAELPKTRKLPVAPPPLYAKDVSQKSPRIEPQAKDQPYFDGPNPFVRIPEGAVGPTFISQNHSPGLTECPNGDLLAVWFSTMGETGIETSNAAARLRFGAKEWEAASPFWDAMDVNDHAPKIWWDGDKTIYHIVEARGHGHNLIRRSTDNGGTWSKAEILRSHGEPANHPIRLKNGTIAMPYDNSSLVVSRDDGKTWQSKGRDRRGSDEVRPGGKGPFIAGYHAPIVELANGRLMAFSRLDDLATQERFQFKMPVNYSSDLGETWEWGISEFPIVSSVQKPVMLRLKEGPIVLCSYTDQWREWKNRRGLTFRSNDGEYTGYGLFAAVSYDDGKTWPDRRLLAPVGKSIADGYGYLAATQTRDGRIQLITSQNHYVFNLAWVKQSPPAPRQ